MTDHEIIFQPDGKRVKIREDQSILDGALLGGIDLTSICGGLGQCGKCKVVIEDQSTTNEITKAEKKLLSTSEIKKNMRLACFTKLMGDVVVKIPEFSRTGKQRLQVEGIDTPIKLNPSVRKEYKKEENKTQVFWEDEIILTEDNDTTDTLYGYAVDIGTTKLAGYLIDLNTGKVAAAGSLMNPQIPHGEDVIARLNHPEPKKLHSLVIEGINEILEELKGKTGIKTNDIYEMVAVGNTVMHHLFLNLSPKSLGMAPYTPLELEARVLDSKNLKININENGKIFLLPVIAGFVGADTLGVVLATELHEKNDICLAIDIGTNTEVVLGNKDKLIACSCASGPAFEGAHINFGMRAASGAIEHIKINPETLELTYETIDNEIPKGICGSAFMDLPPEMLLAGLIDVTGRFNKDVSDVKMRKGQDGLELLIVPVENNDTQVDITFSQKDIRQLILAKAAMQTGILTLLKVLNISNEKITKLFIAGAFGSHIDKNSARTLGIIPEIDLDKVLSVGNAAGTGARMCLVSKEAKEKVKRLAKQIEYVELASDKDFQNTFLNCNSIPFADLSQYPETSKVLKKYGRYPKRIPHVFK